MATSKPKRRARVVVELTEVEVWLLSTPPLERSYRAEQVLRDARRKLERALRGAREERK